MKAGAAACFAILVSCSEAAPPIEGACAGGRALSLAALRVEEAALRTATDFTRPGDALALGPDPYDLAPLAGGGFVGLSRAARTLTALDAGGRPAGPPVPLDTRPRAVAVDGAGGILVGGDDDAILRAFRWDAGTITRVPERDVALDLDTSVRALAFGPNGCVYALSEREDQLVTSCGAERRSVRTPPGPTQIQINNGIVIVTTAIGHALAAARLDAAGFPAVELVSIEHDGPFFGLATAPRGAGVLVAAGGVEDAPLDRTGGFFGNVDSFVWLFAFDGAAWRRLSTVNTSELGVVTPKALALEVRDGEAVTLATGYASDAAVLIRTPLGSDLEGPSGAGEGGTRTESVPSVPGLSKLARGVDGGLVGASTVLDAWVALGPGEAPRVERVQRGPRGQLHLGEALFYTSLMGPWQEATGPKSRFTCETCHLEGGVDGRTHRTGRGDVVATTKPLRGIFNNAPHFTRALDKDTAEMVFAEFGVAAAASANDGWFSLDEAPLAWARDVDLAPDVDRSALGLRRALLGYLAHNAHAPNPRVGARRAFAPLEARGAGLFEARCAGCHAPRLVAGDATSSVPRSEWERLVMSEAGPIVWARDGYEKTGVEPYVHELGARPTSLRRLEDKRPYFTNGSAKTLGVVLERARWDGARFFHDGAPEGAAGLSADERDSLAAFLLLL